MKKKDFIELKGKEITDLLKMVKTKKTELAKLGPKVIAGEEKNLKKAAGLRREVAQFLTLIREKEILKKEEKSENI